jgi:hypothetical protein
VIEKVFGRKFEDIFDSFEEQPIGCGAIAQVRGDVALDCHHESADTSKSGLSSESQTRTPTGLCHSGIHE